MRDIWIAPAQVFDAGRLQPDQALRVTQGQVAGVCAVADMPAGARCHRVAGIITAGFVDLQVNGGGGVLFNASPDAAGIAAIITAHRAFGTVALMPTVITDTPAVLAQAVGAAIAARGLHGFAGLHIEGPHIAPARRGTHAAEYIRPLDDVTFTHLRALRAADVAVMLTLAPEMVSPDQIRALATLGVVVALGHSDATAAVARDAFAAGARAVTHLFNAMSQMQGRAPGLTGAAILGDAHVGVICDGVHVADQMLALAHRARPLAGRMFLVSDAMPTVGGPDRFTLYGHEIRLRDGRLINADGALAGAHTTMQAGVQRLVGQVGLTVQDALQMAVSAPAALIGAPLLGQVSGRRVDDLLVLDAALAVQGTLAQLMP